MTDKIRLGAITDEFSEDLEIALETMHSIGMLGVELRVIAGKNIIELTDDEIERVRQAVTRRQMTVVSIASPLLKCVPPGELELDHRVGHDVFGSAYTLADQPRLTARAFDVAQRLGAGIIRVFSYWRTVDPARCRERVGAALLDLAATARSRGLLIGLENEHACNVGTAHEARAILDMVDHPALKLIWDPANALILGERPYPDGYAQLPAGRIVHVHAKDCDVENFTPTWGPLGQMSVNWTGQIHGLVRDGYTGWINLETHWRGPTGDRRQASLICAASLRQMLTAELRGPRTASMAQ
ncbi:MAG: sugar phosphate isomerase/epimerase family protein [Acidobacteriota bacterium]